MMHHRKKIIFWILNIVLGAGLGACKKKISDNTEQGVSNPPKITFQKIYDGGGYAWESLAQPTKDGGYIITCGLQKPGKEDDFYLAKTDSAGNLLWGKTFGGAFADDAFSVQQTSDEGFIISGLTLSFGQGNTDVYLVRTDKSGKLLWSKAFGGDALDRGWAVVQTSDGGFVVTGDSQSIWGTFLVKLDPNGNIVWTKEFGYRYDSGFSVQQTSDGGFIIGGQANTGVNGYDMTLIKTDINGNLQWAHSYGGPADENGSWVRQTKDGGYIMAGTTNNFDVDDIYIVRTDSKGNLLWSNVYGGNKYDDCSSVLETNDGGFIMLCETFSYGNNLILVIKANSTGNVAWSKTYGSGINGSIEKTRDGGYIISASDKDIYLIKIDENGNSGCNESDVIITPVLYATQVGSPVATVSTTPFTPSTPTTLTGNGGVDSTICYHQQ